MQDAEDVLDVEVLAVEDAEDVLDVEVLAVEDVKDVLDVEDVLEFGDDMFLMWKICWT